MFSITIDEDLELQLPQARHAEEAFRVVQANYEHLHEWMPWCNEELTIDSVKKFFNEALSSFGENGSQIAMSIVFKKRIVGGAGFHEINRSISVPRSATGLRKISRARDHDEMCTNACRLRN